MGKNPLGGLSPKFFLEEGIRDVITFFKFCDDRFRGLASGQILPFPIDFDGRPYNTLTLPCERVICIVALHNWALIPNCAVSPVAVLWTLSNVSVSQVKCGDHDWIQKYAVGYRSCKWERWRPVCHSYGLSLGPHTWQFTWSSLIQSVLHCAEHCIGPTIVRVVQLFTVHRWSTQLVKLSSVVILFGRTPWQLTS